MAGKKTADKAVGRTKGGRNTKLHAVLDGLGNPVGFLLSAGNDHDSLHAIALLKNVRIGESNCTGWSGLWCLDDSGIYFGLWGQLCDSAQKQ